MKLPFCTDFSVLLSLTANEFLKQEYLTGTPKKRCGYPQSSLRVPTNPLRISPKHASDPLEVTTKLAAGISKNIPKPVLLTKIKKIRKSAPVWAKNWQFSHQGVEFLTFPRALPPVAGRGVTSCLFQKDSSRLTTTAHVRFTAVQWGHCKITTLPGRCNGLFRDNEDLADEPVNRLRTVPNTFT